jgi:uncharacterized protein YciI
MKMYIFVILKKGPIKAANKETEDSLFMGHMQNMIRLATEGKLTVAGPFKKNIKNFSGLFILNTQSIEEAKKLLETDPAVKAKLLEPELFEWYGSAALPMYLKYHDTISKSH